MRLDAVTSDQKNPSGLTRNTVAGTDFQYLNSNFTPGKVLGTDIYYERSFSNTKGDDDALGVTINYPNEPWGGDFHFKQLGPNYFPALGFVNRTGIKTYDGNFQRRVQIHPPARERRAQRHAFDELRRNELPVSLRADLVNR